MSDPIVYLFCIFFLFSTYTNTSWKFEQRFASFRAIPNPPVLTYDDFERTVSSGREGLPNGKGENTGEMRERESDGRREIQTEREK